MSEINERVRLSADLGAGPGAMAAAMERALLDVVGGSGEFAPASLSLDYGAPATPGEHLALEAWIDRAARTVIFAQAEARRVSDGVLVAIASGMFRRVGA